MKQLNNELLLRLRPPLLPYVRRKTKPMQTEAITVGFFESKTWGKKYPKIQLLTIAELLSGKRIDMPPIRQVDRVFKNAERFKGEGISCRLINKTQRFQ